MNTENAQEELNTKWTKVPSDICVQSDQFSLYTLRNLGAMATHRAPSTTDRIARTRELWVDSAHMSDDTLWHVLCQWNSNRKIAVCYMRTPKAPSRADHIARIRCLIWVRWAHKSVDTLWYVLSQFTGWNEAAIVKISVCLMPTTKAQSSLCMRTV